MNSVVTFPERLLPSRRAAGALRGGGEGEAAGRTRATGEERGRRRRRRRTRLRNMATRLLLSKLLNDSERFNWISKSLS